MSTPQETRPGANGHPTDATPTVARSNDLLIVGQEIRNLQRFVANTKTDLSLFVQQIPAELRQLVNVSKDVLKDCEASFDFEHELSVVVEAHRQVLSYKGKLRIEKDKP